MSGSVFGTEGVLPVNITLLEPQNNSYFNGTTPFSFNITNVTQSLNCSLYGNFSDNQFLPVTWRNVNQSKIYGMGLLQDELLSLQHNDSYTWAIRCMNDSSAYKWSENHTFIFNASGLTPIYNLTFQIQTSLDKYVAPGTTAEYTFNVTNHGSSAEYTFNLTGDVVDLNYTVSPNNTYLGHLSSNQIFVHVNTTVEGAYNFDLIATPTMNISVHQNASDGAGMMYLHVNTSNNPIINMSVVKDTPNDPYTKNQAFQYSINITNTGQTNLTSILLNDTFPKELNFTGSPCPILSNHTGDNITTNHALINASDCMTMPLEPAQSFEIPLHFTALENGTDVVNRVEVYATDSLNQTFNVTENRSVDILIDDDTKSEDGGGHGPGNLIDPYSSGISPSWIEKGTNMLITGATGTGRTGTAPD